MKNYRFHGESTYPIQLLSSKRHEERFRVPLSLKITEDKKEKKRSSGFSPPWNTSANRGERFAIIIMTEYWWWMFGLFTPTGNFKSRCYNFILLTRCCVPGAGCPKHGIRQTKVSYNIQQMKVLYDIRQTACDNKFSGVWLPVVSRWSANLIDSSSVTEYLASPHRP